MSWPAILPGRRWRCRYRSWPVGCGGCRSVGRPTARTWSRRSRNFSWGDAFKAVGVVAAGTVVAAGVVLAPEITIPALVLGGGAAAAAA